MSRERPLSLRDLRRLLARMQTSPAEAARIAGRPVLVGVAPAERGSGLHVTPHRADVETLVRTLVGAGTLERAVAHAVRALDAAIAAHGPRALVCLRWAQTGYVWARPQAARQDHRVGAEAPISDGPHADPAAAAHGGDGNSGECPHPAQTVADDHREGMLTEAAGGAGHPAGPAGPARPPQAQPQGTAPGGTVPAGQDPGDGAPAGGGVPAAAEAAAAEARHPVQADAERVSATAGEMGPPAAAAKARHTDPTASRPGDGEVPAEGVALRAAAVPPLASFPEADGREAGSPAEPPTQDDGTGGGPGWAGEDVVPGRMAEAAATDGLPEPRVFPLPRQRVSVLPELLAAMRRLADRFGGAGEPARRIVPRALVREVVTRRYALARARARLGRLRTLVLVVDLSGSCSHVAADLYAQAVGLAQRLPDLLIATTGDVTLEGEPGRLIGQRAVQVREAILAGRCRDPEDPWGRCWEAAGVSAVVILGDWHGAAHYRRMAAQGVPVYWLDHYTCTSVGRVRDHTRQADLWKDWPVPPRRYLVGVGTVEQLREAALRLCRAA